jgi:hypothetical protein
LSQDRFEWYADESYDCSPVARTYSNPIETLKAIGVQVQVAVTVNIEHACNQLQLMGKVINELYPSTSLKFDPHVPTRLPHSMTPDPRSHVFDRRGRKRY